MDENVTSTETAPVDAIDEAIALFRELLEAGRLGEAKSLLLELHPADQSDLIAEAEPEPRQPLIPLLEPEELAHIIEQLEGPDRGNLVDQIPLRQLARVLDRTDSDVAADVLRHIERYDASAVLAAMLPANASQVMPLLVHEDESAGGLMTRGYITLPARLTAAAAIAYLRLSKPDAQEAYYLYVVDDQQRLEGVVSLRYLITAAPDTPVSELMSRDVIAVPPDADQEECAELLRRYDLLALPVVDEERHLLGVMTADDLMDVMQEEATEDIYHMAGLATTESALSPLRMSLRRRVPWLLINLSTSFLAALVVSLFDHTIAQVALLAAFMPIIAGHGGNTGTQAVTLVVRGIALGEVRLRDVLVLLRKEVAFGLIHGLLAGSLTAVLAFVLSGNAWLSVLVLIAMVGNLVVAGVAGALIPLGLQKIRVDPALASAIWLTTFTDVMGFALLLGLATLFLPELR